jgi:hypothetical protein
MNKYIVEFKLSNGDVIYDRLTSEQDVKEFNKIVAKTFTMLPIYTIINNQGNITNINTSQVLYFNLIKSV